MSATTKTRQNARHSAPSGFGYGRPEKQPEAISARDFGPETARGDDASRQDEIMRHYQRGVLAMARIWFDEELARLKSQKGAE